MGSKKSDKKSKKWEVKEDKYMSKAESQELLGYCEDKHHADIAKGRTTWIKHYMLVDLALKSGLRVSEIKDLKVSDLNLGSIPSVHVANGKGGTKRDVTIDPALKKHLKEFVNRFDLNEDDYLFCSGKGGQLTRQGLEKNFYRIVAKAGLRKYSIHACRHTFATRHYGNNKDLEMLRRALGHARIETTTVYVGLSKEDALVAATGLYDD